MKKFILGILFFLPTFAFAKDVENIGLGKVLFSENNIELITTKGHVVKIPVNSDTMHINLRGHYKNDAKDRIIFLFEQSNGGNACPATYFVYETNFKNIGKKSSVFGTCSDVPMIKHNNNTLILTMPQLDGKREVIFKYENGRVFENGKTIK